MPTSSGNAVPCTPRSSPRCRDGSRWLTESRRLEMQTLLLVRHAIAEERGSAWPDDTVRPLTQKGELRMREIARRLKAIGETSDVVVSSPLKRAKDTALILKRVWSKSSDVEEVDALAP